MRKMTIDERLREATREVASAFHVPLSQVELVTDRLKKQAIEEAFGADPRGPIAEELAREIKAEIQEGLEALSERMDDEFLPVIEFPKPVARHPDGELPAAQPPAPQPPAPQPEAQQQA